MNHDHLGLLSTRLETDRDAGRWLVPDTPRVDKPVRRFDDLKLTFDDQGLAVWQQVVDPVAPADAKVDLRP